MFQNRSLPLFCLAKVPACFLGHARILALIAYRIPIAIFLPGFLVGQVAGLSIASVAGVRLAYWDILDLFAFILMGLGLLKLRSRSLFRITAVAILVGFFSCPLVLPDQELNFTDDETVLGLVEEEPRYPKPGLVDLTLLVSQMKRPANQSKFDSELDPASINKRLKCKGVELPWKNIHQMERGSVFLFRAKFLPLRASFSPFSFDNQLLRQGYIGTCKILFSSEELARIEPWAWRLHRRIEALEAGTFESLEISQLLLSMSIGSQDLLSARTSEAFKRAGLAHLLVVSGYQVSLFFGVVFYIARNVLLRVTVLRRRACVTSLGALIGVVCAFGFVLISGIQGSSLRAALAVIFSASVLILERRPGFGKTILVSLLILSIIWPACILDPGVELTFAALVGLWIGCINQSSFSFLDAVKACTYSCVATSIVVLSWFGTISLLGFILNPLIAGPVGAIVCNGVFLGLLLRWLEIDTSGCVLSCLGAFVTWFRDGVLYLSSFNGVALTLDGKSRALIILALILFILHGLARRAKAALMQL